MRLDESRIVHLHAPDARRDWWLHAGPSGLYILDEGSASDCSVAATASDLYTLLWNRRGLDGLQVGGDESLLHQWRQAARVRWS